MDAIESRPEEARILLLRHAETAAPELFHGEESDVPLGTRGFLQAEAAARRLAAENPDAVYSSVMIRARQTAGPIARMAGVEPRIVPGIHERRMGTLSARPKLEGNPIYQATVALWKRGEIDATHPGAESFAQIRDRVIPAIDGLANRHPGGTIAVVVHGVVIRVLVTSLVDGLGPADYDEVGIDFVAVHDLRRAGDRWRLESPIEGLPSRSIED